MIDGHRTAASHVLSDEYLFIFVFETTITNDRTSSTYGSATDYRWFPSAWPRVSVDVFNYDAHTNGDDTLRERILCVYTRSTVWVYLYRIITQVFVIKKNAPIYNKINSIRVCRQRLFDVYLPNHYVKFTLWTN